MKKVIIYIYGNTYFDLAVAAEHAAGQLHMGTPSENITWEDESHVDYTVKENSPSYDEDTE